MVQQIEGNVYSIAVPLPENPLRSLNAYVIKAEKGERSLLIDTGFRRRECYDALTAGLDELGLTAGDIDIYLTHLHSDHTGLIGDLANDDTRVYISEEDGRRMDEFRINGETYQARRYALYGFSADEIERLNESPMRAYGSSRRVAWTAVYDGDTIEYGGRRLRVIMTPGHTPGHTCLYDAEDKIMFLGDHVLFDITPNITTWDAYSDPLGAYIHSLLDISIYAVRVPLPAHRGINGSMSERIGAIIEHHGARIREMLDILDGAGLMTPYELSGKMTWRVRGKSSAWEDFPLQQKWFAVGETAAHLEYLAARGRVRSEMSGGVIRYYTK